MNKSTYQLPEQEIETGIQRRRIVRAAVIMAAGAGITTWVYTYLASQNSKSWQLTVVAVTVFLYFLTCLGLIALAPRRPSLSARLLIGGYLVGFLIFSLAISSFGLVLGAASILLTSMLASQILPPRQSQQMLVASVVMGLLMFLPDIIFPMQATLRDYRYPAPSIFYTYIPVMLGLLVVVYGYFAARQFSSYSLRTKLIMAFLLVTLIVLGSLTVLTNWGTQQTLTNVANEKLVGAATQAVVSIDAFITFNLNAIQAEAKLPALAAYLSLPREQRVGNPLEAEVTKILQALTEKDKNRVSSYGLLDLQGVNVLDTYGPEIGKSRADQDYFVQPLTTGEPYASSVQFTDIAGGAAIYFSTPVRDEEDKIVGVLRMRYSASVLQQLIFKTNGLAGQRSFAMLLDENYMSLAHGQNPGLNFKVVVPLAQAKLAELQKAKRLPSGPIENLSAPLPGLAAGLTRVNTDSPYFSGETNSDQGDNADKEQVAVVKLKTKPWLVTFSEPQSEFLAPLQAQTRMILFLAVIIMILVTFVAVGVGQYLASPIVRLTQVAQRVAGGDLAARAPIETQDETGQLATVFNTMTNQLQSLIGSLEDQVRERMVELSLSVQVGQQAAAIRDLSELLTTITEFIRDRFNLYYTQIYFVDDIGENLVLKAGTGEVGTELLARHHSLPIGGNSIVGQVASSKQPVVVSDTTKSDIHQPNALLPETHSELAIPLTVEGQVIGVLDMQASQVNTFIPDNLTVFEAMATQLAISIDGAQQWARAQEARQRAEEAIRLLTREGWSDRLASHPEGKLGFAYNLSAITPLRSEPETNGYEAISATVAVQQEPIGRLAVEVPPARKWTDDERSLVEAVAQQLGQKAENLRLFELTQQRAAREQMARQIVDKVRASRDVETALQTVAQELAQVLRTKAVIDLRVAPDNEAAGASPNKKADGGATIGQLHSLDHNGK